MATQTPHSNPNDTQRELESERKKEMKTALTNDKAQIAAVSGTGAGIAAGAAIGSIVPGIGTAFGAIVGGAIGAVAGAVGGAAIGSAIDHKEYDAYWRKHYVTRPYARDVDYDTLAPAYRFGWEARHRFEPTRQWDDVEQDLGREWSKYRGDEDRLPWDAARHASRDAWEHVDSNRIPTNVDPRSGRP